MNNTHLNLDSVHQNGDGTFTVTNRANRRIIKTIRTVNEFPTVDEWREFMRRIVAAMRFCRHLTTEFLETHVASEDGQDVWEVEKKVSA